MKFEAVDEIKEDLSDGEYEQTAAEMTPSMKTTERPCNPALLLSELEESERTGRFCRVLQYQPKSNDSELTDEKVPDLTADLIIEGTGEASDKKHVCKICGAELKLHAEDCGICGTGCGIRSGSAENESHAYERGTETDFDPTSSGPANGKAPFPQTEKHVCDLCGIEYARKCNLNSHMRIHTGETPFTCKICGKGFRRSDWLAKHMNKHKDKRQASLESREKQYACDHCEKTYIQRQSLRNHLRTHTGERPYQCAICEKRFYDGCSLKKHLACHWDDRPYACSECGHSFKRVETLNKHKRIHTGETPYSCSVCGKTFRYSYSLCQHMKLCSSAQSLIGRVDQTTEASSSETPNNTTEFEASA